MAQIPSWRLIAFALAQTQRIWYTFCRPRLSVSDCRPQGRELKQIQNRRESGTPRRGPNLPGLLLFLALSPFSQLP